MLDRAKRLSSTQDFLSQECKNLKEIFLKLKYPEKLINSAINRLQHPKDPFQAPSDSPVRITLSFKDQKSADVVRRQLGDLSPVVQKPIKVAPYGYSLFVLRALVSTILGNLPITLSCTSLEPIEIKFWEIKLPF